ncbi:hypothetical protein [Arthrobacter sp. GCM10027362]|uniref:hypothetical protein n=1 Tax=Arthrobacter sp. GCM10027362 TaxID=3273379 RepID=UPI00366FEAC3
MRASHPLRSGSGQPLPNCSREYPVFGARPLIVMLASCSGGVPAAAGFDGPRAASWVGVEAGSVEGAAVQVVSAALAGAGTSVSVAGMRT